MNFKIIFIALITSVSIASANAQSLQINKKQWIDSVYNALTEEERIGQLFMVAAYSGGDNANSTQIEQLLKNKQIGGLIFMQGSPEAQAQLTNKFQRMAQVPLLIGMDAEWGLGMRLTGVRNFPRQMMLGASTDSGLVYDLGAAVAEQCKRLGVHINFAPTIDINNNPNNPVINFRSFGEDKENVSKLGIAYMKGMQNNGIMACAKHFPGHGDVAVDSHLDLPIIKKSKEQLSELELYPFRKLIEAGVQSIMIAHLNVPALDKTPNLPTTLSVPTVTDLLIHDMNYSGLIFTDALNMKGVTKFFPDGDTDLRAFLAGNDVLLFSQNVPLAIKKIKNAIQEGKSSQEILEKRVKKILSAKYDAGLWQLTNISTTNIVSDLNKSIDEFTLRASQSSITLVADDNALLEKTKMTGSKIAYINVNGTANNDFEQGLKKNYPGIALARVDQNTSFANANTLIGRYNTHDVVVVGVHKTNWYPGKSGRYGLSKNQADFLRSISKKNNVIIVVFGNAYLNKHLCNGNAAAIFTYEENTHTQRAALDLLKGNIRAKGKLPVSACM